MTVYTGVYLGSDLIVMNYTGSTNNNVQFTLGRFTPVSRNENTGSTLCFLTYPG